MGLLEKKPTPTSFLVKLHGHINKKVLERARTRNLFIYNQEHFLTHIAKGSSHSNADINFQLTENINAQLCMHTYREIIKFT